MTGRVRDVGREGAPPAPPAGVGTPREPSPRLVVVARGQAGLAADLRALFGRETGIVVVENRRRDRALLPRPTRAGPPARAAGAR